MEQLMVVREQLVSPPGLVRELLWLGEAIPVALLGPLRELSRGEVEVLPGQ